MMLEETLFMPDRHLFQGREKLAGTATVTISKKHKKAKTSLILLSLSFSSGLHELKKKKHTKNLFIATINI